MRRRGNIFNGSSPPSNITSKSTFFFRFTSYSASLIRPMFFLHLIDVILEFDAFAAWILRPGSYQFYVLPKIGYVRVCAMYIVHTRQSSPDFFSLDHSWLFWDLRPCLKIQCFLNHPYICIHILVLREFLSWLFPRKFLIGPLNCENRIFF